MDLCSVSKCPSLSLITPKEKTKVFSWSLSSWNIWLVLCYQEIQWIPNIEYNLLVFLECSNLSFATTDLRVCVFKVKQYAWCIKRKIHEFSTSKNNKKLYLNHCPPNIENLLLNWSYHLLKKRLKKFSLIVVFFKHLACTISSRNSMKSK